jgi:hypothetical protein
MWIDAKKETPKLIEDELYSLNVLAVCNGTLAVMCYCCIPGEGGGYMWANCNNQIDGEGEFDDDYEVTHWQYFPELPEKKVLQQTPCSTPLLDKLKQMTEDLISERKKYPKMWTDDVIRMLNKLQELAAMKI